MMATGDKATICKIKKKMMNNVEINKDVKLSQHLTSSSVAALSHSSKLDGLR